MNLRRRESEREREEATATTSTKKNCTNVTLHTTIHSVSTRTKKRCTKKTKFCVFSCEFYSLFLRWMHPSIHFSRFSTFLQRILLRFSVKFARNIKVREGERVKVTWGDGKKKEGKFIFGRLGHDACLVHNFACKTCWV